MAPDTGVRPICDSITKVTSESQVKQTKRVAAPKPVRSDADVKMRRFLRISDSKQVSHEAAQSAFQTSMLVSSVRCLLTYIVLPFVAPLLGVAASIGEPLGIVVALVAMFSITLSMRRFFGSDHPKRWQYAAVAGVMFCFLIYLLVTDIIGVLS